MSYATAQDVQAACRARMHGAMIDALAEAQLGGAPIPQRFCAAANAGAIEGLADALGTLIATASAKPDSTAQIIADRIRTDVAIKTSGGCA